MAREKFLWCQWLGIVEDKKCMKATVGGKEYCPEHDLGVIWPQDDDPEPEPAPEVPNERKRELSEV
jgi:hypothetical protein